MWLWIHPIVWAHGPSPSVVGIGAADGNTPALLPLTEGAATWDGQGWRFVCPARWGSSPESPYILGTGGGGWIPGATDLYWMSLDGVATGTATPELAADQVLGYAIDGVAVVVLRRPEAGGTEVWALPPRRLASLPGAYDTLALSGDTIRLAGVDGGTVTMVEIDATDGGVRSEDVLALDASWTPALRATPNAWYLLERAAGAFVLNVLRGSERVPLVSSPLDVLGPIHTREGDLAAVDGRLAWVHGDGVAPTGDDTVVSCLGSHDGVAWACAEPDLRSVVGGRLDATLTPLPLLGAEGFSGVATEHCADCIAEWVRIAADVGQASPLDGLGACPAVEPGDTGVPSCGCASDPRSFGAAALLSLVLWSRRRTSES